MELRHIAEKGGRLSDILRCEMALSSGQINRLKWEKRFLVNGTPQLTNFPVCAGDEVVAILDEAAPEYPAEDSPLTILYEDPHLLAVDKPAGMLIHPSRSRNTGTLANAVAGYYRRSGQSCAFHPLTRLDRDTFGVVLLAKSSHIHARLQALAREGRVEKVYHGLVFGVFDPPEGVIDAPIARRPLPSLLRYIDASGKPSRTEYRLLQSFETSSLVALRPITGRTHQLRLHCAYLGHPILGDPQYGSTASQALSAELNFTTQQLCAKYLRLPHPVTGQELEICSQLEIVK